MAAADYFSSSYTAAREKFRAAARDAGAALESHRNPASGPAGEALSTDTARLGPARAARLLVTISATHGAEGFCGSGIQVGSLIAGLYGDLPPDTAVLAVHAINPHGFAWLRRVTEGNIDLNRNYVDHAAPYPANEGYETLQDAICPREWSDAALARARAILDAYAAEHGDMALQAAMSAGQYTHPDGVFHGGRAPTWSHRTLIDILRREGAGAARVAVIDLHSGLGPYGHGEIINDHAPGTAGFGRVVAWYGDEATSSEAGTSTSAVVQGHTLLGVLGAVPRAEVTGVTLEYGTAPLDEVLTALRADNWLHLHGDPASAQGREIKGRLRRAFYPDADDWKQMVWKRAAEVQRRALAGLAGP
ncbi:MAG: M14 family metallopeptidase [Dongiaceae bacterium]